MLHLRFIVVLIYFLVYNNRMIFTNTLQSHDYSLSQILNFSLAVNTFEHVSMYSETESFSHSVF